MARRSVITQAAIARAVKGAQAAGLKVGRVEIEGDRIVIHSGEEPAGPMTKLEAWRASRGAR
ncbi:hypothetical protein [Methylorubrum extorquens]|uniref:Uncharacterized protein n=1 Tax=Methylorubrum extorquens DSM 13060 TaxID=882800 RepID=H1KHQ4_METEX|nr:hypothetical protein [Methylorubrum extorquens]EHP92932.1 hypothetical protein MetexDRAFT_2166 [Methylorubrum extorquens DSM 13060]